MIFFLLQNTKIQIIYIVKKAYLWFYPKMESSKKEESQRGWAVQQANIISCPGQQEAAHQAQDHVHVLVHAKGQEVPLGQGGADRHHSCCQVDYLQ